MSELHAGGRAMSIPSKGDTHMSDFFQKNQLNPSDTSSSIKARQIRRQT